LGERLDDEPDDDVRDDICGLLRELARHPDAVRSTIAGVEALSVTRGPDADRGRRHAVRRRIIRRRGARRRRTARGVRGAARGGTRAGPCTAREVGAASVGVAGGQGLAGSTRASGPGKYTDSWPSCHRTR
jgi:hypothetical protein